MNAGADEVERRRPAALHWSIRDAARRLGIRPETLERRIERGDLVAVPGAGDRGLTIAAAELSRYEAAHRSSAAAQLAQAEPLLVGALELHFPLVKVDEDGDRHALPAGAEGGAALCGVEPEGDWYLVGIARRAFLIPCPACRERAAEIVATAGGGSAA
jgi:hypothetical protein